MKKQLFRLVLIGTLVMTAALFVAGTRVALGADVYALIAEENGNFDQLDITTGTKVVIGNNDDIYLGLAFNSNGTILYGIVTGSNGDVTRLVTINPATGVNTLIGSNGVALTTITNLANGQLYGVDFEDDLYQIDPNTGAATLVGATGLPALSTFDNSLASDGTTLYYTLDTNGGDSTLYTLSLTTGVATAIGSTGTSGINGSVFAASSAGTGQLYGFSTSGNTYVINLSTGAATELNSNGITDYFGGVGIVTASSFFSGQVYLGNGVNYLSFPNGNYFGYYSYLENPLYIYHFDLGFEYIFDANDGNSGVYFYDFASNTFFYTSPIFPFPYLYDFTLNAVLYYYPDTTNAGHYTTNPRYFFDFATNKIITK